MIKGKVDKPMQIISASVISVVALLVVFFEEDSKAIINKLFNYFTTNLDVLYLWVGFACFVFVLWVGLSKYGNIVLSRDKDSKPAFSKFSWLAMMFSTGIATGLIIWAFIEWGYGIKVPPMGFDAMSKEAIISSTAYGIFHWGPTAWAIFCVFSLTTSYIYYVKGNYIYKVSEGCRGVLGKYTDGILGKFIDYLFIFMILAAVTTALGLGVPLIGDAIAELFGITNSLPLRILLVIVVTVIFTVSSLVGVEKGMSRLANFGVVAMLIFVAYIFIVGPTVFILKYGSDSLAFLFKNFLYMNFGVEALANKTVDGVQTVVAQSASYPQWWTVFYWSWWLIFAPYVGLFVTRISRGRTIREVVFGMLVLGSLGSAIFYIVLGGYGVDLYLNKVFDLPNALSEIGTTLSIVTIVKTLPLTAILLIILIISSITMLANSLDSASATMAAVSTIDEIPEGEEPSIANKFFWCVLISILPIAFLIIGAELKPIQTLSLVVGFPAIFIAIFMMITLYKDLQADEINTKD